MTITRSIVSAVLLATGACVAPLGAQVAVSITTNLSGPTLFSPTPFANSGLVPFYADLLFIDDLQIEYALSGCDLGPARLVSTISVRNLSLAPRDVEIVIVQEGVDLARPSFVTASVSATMSTLFGGGTVSDVSGSPLFRAELAGTPVFDALPGPFLFSETGVAASILGTHTTGGAVAGPEGLGDLQHTVRLSIAGEAVVTISAVVKVDATGVPDLDGNGVIGGEDLGMLLDAWGPAKPFGPGDLDGDGSVDGADLGMLLSEFGSVVGCG